MYVCYSFCQLGANRPFFTPSYYGGGFGDLTTDLTTFLTPLFNSTYDPYMPIMRALPVVRSIHFLKT